MAETPPDEQPDREPGDSGDARSAGSAAPAHRVGNPPGLSGQPANDWHPVDVPVTRERLPKAVAERGLSWGTVHLKLLESLAPPSILVDREHEIVHMSEHAGAFLQHPGGEPTRNLLRLAHPGLRFALRTALQRAAQLGAMAQVDVQRVALARGEAAVQVRAWPVQDLEADLYMVLLDARTQGAGPAGGTLPADEAATRLGPALERQAAQRREAVERHEASTAELEARIAQLRASNDELRSANASLTCANRALESKVEELAHARSDMRNLANAASIATVFLDRDLAIMRYTPTAAELFDLVPSDVGRPLADLSTRLDDPRLRQDAQEVLRTLVPLGREVGVPDGRWFLLRMLPYRTEEDRIAGLVLSFIDISRRRQAEEARHWLSAVVSAVNDAIVSFTWDDTIVSWNSGAQRMYGYTAAEAIGRPLALLQGDEADTSATELARAAAEGRVLANVDLVHRYKDGRPVSVSLSAAPIVDEHGRVIGGTAVARDVTQAREDAQALRASEERLRHIVENARDYAIFSIDLERRVTSWNVGAERLLGYSGREMLGQLADVIFTDEDRATQQPQQEIAQALAEGRASDDRMHRRKDGSQFWASGMAMLMRGEGGEAIGFVKILRDQTAERDAQEALRRSQAELIDALAETQRARQQLEAADAAKDRFMAVLSHELRNPLASIASASELLLMPRLPGAALEKAAQVVQRQARAMKVLLDELLDVSRLTLGRLTLNRRTITVASFIHAALETTRPLVQAAGHELAVSLPPGAIEVDGDATRLSQVISNLVTNSAKYTPEGGRIAISAEAMQDEVVITVRDNGIGMDPAEIDRMFDLFSQGRGALQHANGGLGIGLALARNIVEMHGGWILASSAGPGKGSQFRVGLPMLRVHADGHEEMPEPEGATHEPAPPAQGELILVADDNSDAAWGLSKLLELSGYRAITARSGEEALRLAEEHKPAVALLDIGMPDLSGHDVARRVRGKRWGRKMILIAATGWGQEADVRQSMEAGFDAHLTKPLNVARIRGLIDELVDKRGK